MNLILKYEFEIKTLSSLVLLKVKLKNGSVKFDMPDCLTDHLFSFTIYEGEVYVYLSKDVLKVLKGGVGQ